MTTWGTSASPDEGSQFKKANRQLSYKRLTDNTRASGARGGVYPLYYRFVLSVKGQCRNIWGDKLIKAVELLTLKRAFASYL